MKDLKQIIASNNIPSSNKPLVFWSEQTVEREYSNIPTLPDYNNPLWIHYKKGDIYGENMSVTVERIKAAMRSCPKNHSIGYAYDGHTCKAYLFDNYRKIL
jgi:hypothetical protein